jgi:hypothetical protein
MALKSILWVPKRWSHTQPEAWESLPAEVGIHGYRGSNNSISAARLVFINEFVAMVNGPHLHQTGMNTGSRVSLSQGTSNVSCASAIYWSIESLSVAFKFS